MISISMTSRDDWREVEKKKEKSKFDTIRVRVGH